MKKSIFNLLIIILCNISMDSIAQKSFSKKNIELSIQKSTKIGTSGIAKGDNLLQFTNYSVNDILFELLSEQSELEIQKPKLKVAKLDITLRTSSEMLEAGKQILLDSLVKRYNLKIKSTIKKRNIEALYLIDKAKFNNILSESNRKDGVLKKEEFTGKQLILTNSSVDDLANSLSHYLKESIEDHTGTKTKQDFNLLIYPKNILQEQLASIGLKLVKKEKNLKVISIL